MFSHLMSPWQMPCSWLCATACSSWNAIQCCSARRIAVQACKPVLDECNPVLQGSIAVEACKPALDERDPVLQGIFLGFRA